MKRIHVALAVRDLNEAVREYTERLGAKPYCTVEGTYALWRTDHVNLSVSVKPEEAGTLRHLGFEDSEATGFGEERDANGFAWERFTLEQQDEEIRQRWPHAKFA
jgi:catechol 2,3-dioxygenase-like lactoylglutathione lyase family enzyme